MCVCVCVLAGCLCIRTTDREPHKAVDLSTSVTTVSAASSTQPRIQVVLMNILANSRDAVCSSTLSYRRGLLRLKFVFSISGTLGHLYFLSSEKGAVRWPARSHPHPGLFWASHTHQQSPQLALQFKQPRGYCYGGKRLKACQTVANDFR